MEHGDLRAKVIAKIDELSEQGLADLWNMLSRRLPEKASALWLERTSGREVTAVDFIRTHYADWLPADAGDPESDRQIDGLKMICDELHIEKLSAVSRHRPAYERVIEFNRAP